MTSRSRLQLTLHHGIADRVPMTDTCYWPQTVERWRTEGLPDGVEPADHFGLDPIATFGFRSDLGLPEEVLEENERWRIYRGPNGCSVKEWKPDSGEYAPPARVDCLVKTWEEWRKVRDRLTVDPARVAEADYERYRQLRERDTFIALSPTEPMWFLIEALTGFQDGLPMLAAEPELARDIITRHADFTLGMCQYLVDRGLKFDALWFFADLCYKNGMLFSPQCYRELVRPVHARFKEWCAAHDLPLLLHCDGDVRELLPLLIEVGFDAIQPLEARCGNDVRDLKQQYGTDIVFFGNISADVLASGTDDEVEAEVTSKVLAAKAGGGYIYHIDHSVSPTISLARYARALALVREHGAYD
jgi:hypothetical protein